MSGATGGDFLQEMARSSAARVVAARAAEGDAALKRRALAAAPAPHLALSSAGFDLIAELKLRSPAAGQLRGADEDVPARVRAAQLPGAVSYTHLTLPTIYSV